MSDSGIINYKSQQLVLAMLFSHHNNTIKRRESENKLLACNHYLRIKCLQNAMGVNEPLGYSCG